jgi:hypothetical protein
MVNPVGGSPQQAVIQQANTALAQDVRQRNEQTQPRQAPAADTQRHTLQTRGDDQRRQHHFAAQQQKREQESQGGAEQPETSRRGQLVDVQA